MRKPTRTASFAATGLLALFAALLLYAAWLPPPTPISRPADRARFMTGEQAKVRAELPDPDSATFRNARASISRRAPVLCGEVNTKTDTGAYAGFQRFISGATVRVYEREIGRVDMDRLWQVHCRNHRPSREAP